MCQLSSWWSHMPSRCRKLQSFLSILDKLTNNSKMYSPFILLHLAIIKVGNSMLSEFFFFFLTPYGVGFLFYPPPPIISKVQGVNLNIYLVWTWSVELSYFPHWSHVLHLASLLKLLWPRHMENISRYVTASKNVY